MWPTKFAMLKLGIIFCLYLPATYAGIMPAAELVLTQMDYLKYNQDYFEKCDLYLVPYRGRNALNGTFIYARSMAKMNVRLVLDFEKPDKTRFQMLNITADACRLLNGEMRKNNFVKILMKQLDDQLNFVQRCPIEAKRAYDLVMCGAEPTEFPLANLKFMFSVTMYDEDNKIKIAEFRLKGATKRRV